VAEWVADAAGRRRLTAELATTADLGRIAARIALASARPRDLAALRETLARLPAIRAALAANAAPLVVSLAADLDVEPRWATLLAGAIAPEPAAQGSRRRRDRSRYDAELDELRAIDEHCGEFLVALEGHERERTGIANLKVEYNRVHGFYIEVTHANVGRIPDDYRRRQTLKNAERYITPELKAFEDKALSAQERALAREKLLYERLLADLAPAIAALQVAGAALATLDVLASFAERAEALDLARPVFVPATGPPSAAADIRWSSGRSTSSSPMISISRPTGGCSSSPGPTWAASPRTCARRRWIVLLAHCGSFVPADSAHIGPLDAIHTRIGAADDLAGGRARPHGRNDRGGSDPAPCHVAELVLIDEIGRGTSTFDGLALRMGRSRTSWRRRTARWRCSRPTISS